MYVIVGDGYNLFLTVREDNTHINIRKNMYNIVIFTQHMMTTINYMMSIFVKTVSTTIYNMSEMILYMNMND